jgi:hypothetical protein
MKKKLEIVVEDTCQKCPYCNYCEEGSENEYDLYFCRHPELEKALLISVVCNVFPPIPKECKLKDYKGE